MPKWLSSQPKRGTETGSIPRCGLAERTGLEPAASDVTGHRSDIDPAVSLHFSAFHNAETRFVTHRKPNTSPTHCRERQRSRYVGGPVMLPSCNVPRGTTPRAPSPPPQGITAQGANWALATLLGPSWGMQTTGTWDQGQIAPKLGQIHWKNRIFCGPLKACHALARLCNRGDVQP